VPGPILPPAALPALPAPPAQTTAAAICLNALYEINVVAPGEPADALEIAFVLDKFNQLADSWSAQKIYIYASQLISASPAAAAFLLVPGLSPHTIGAAGATFPVIFERPVRIENINVLLNNATPTVRYPLTKRDRDWYAKQRLQGIQTSLPTDFYYRPDWPVGSIFFWPVPNFAWGVEIEVESVIQGAVALNAPFIAPPGYELAMTLTLAELCCPSFEKMPSPVLVAAAMKARLAIASVNSESPRIALDDFGDSSSAKPRASFNYHTGMSR